MQNSLDLCRELLSVRSQTSVSLRESSARQCCFWRVSEQEWPLHPEHEAMNSQFRLGAIAATGYGRFVPSSPAAMWIFDAEKLSDRAILHAGVSLYEQVVAGGKITNDGSLKLNQWNTSRGSSGIRGIFPSLFL